MSTKSKPTGISGATVFDYQSNSEIGRATVNWTQYNAWASGPSEVCEARRCLSAGEIEYLGIQPETVIFLIE